jgi:hypothetical protein
VVTRTYSIENGEMLLFLLNTHVKTAVGAEKLEKPPFSFFPALIFLPVDGA